MMRLNPVSRAMTASVAIASVLAIAGVAYAGAAGREEAAEGPSAAPAAAAVETKAEKPFKPSIACGPTIGYADQSAEGGDFGWGVGVLARVIKYGGLQLEYWSLGNASKPSGGGHFDGLYVGVMPMFPIGDTGLNVFGQVGAAFSDEGNNVAGGGGLLYAVPIEFLDKNNVDLLLRLDYKYFNIEDQGDDGQHLLTFGFMVGFHK